jgi:hypothetical protein
MVARGRGIAADSEPVRSSLLCPAAAAPGRQGSPRHRGDSFGGVAGTCMFGACNPTGGRRALPGIPRCVAGWQTCCDASPGPPSPYMHATPMLTPPPDPCRPISPHLTGSSSLSTPRRKALASRRSSAPRRPTFCEAPSAALTSPGWGLRGTRSSPEAGWRLAARPGRPLLRRRPSRRWRCASGP